MIDRIEMNHSLDEAQKALERYKADGVGAIDLPLCEPDEIRWDVYQAVFLNFWDGWEHICLEMNRRYAAFSLQTFENEQETAPDEGRNGYIHITALLAKTMINHYVWYGDQLPAAKESFSRLLPQVAKIWCDTWRGIPEFEEALREIWAKYHSDIEIPID